MTPVLKFFCQGESERERVRVRERERERERERNEKRKDFFGFQSFKWLFMRLHFVGLSYSCQKKMTKTDIFSTFLLFCCFFPDRNFCFDADFFFFSSWKVSHHLLHFLIPSVCQRLCQFFCSTSLPLTSTRWFNQYIQSFSFL